MFSMRTPARTKAAPPLSVATPPLSVATPNMGHSQHQQSSNQPLPCSIGTITASENNSNPNFVESHKKEDLFEKQLEPLYRELRKFDLPH